MKVLRFLFILCFTQTLSASSALDDAFILHVGGASWPADQEAFTFSNPHAKALTLSFDGTCAKITPLDDETVQRSLPGLASPERFSPAPQEGIFYAAATIDPGEGLLVACSQLPGVVAILFHRTHELSALEEGCVFGPRPAMACPPITAMLFNKVTLYRTPPEALLLGTLTGSDEEPSLPEGVTLVRLDNQN
ncbi:MAG: hypothetical protein LCH26_03390 [Proteobacteria bacterium]|nr:hypothetical protein [Pseudomonadota bacterium]